MGAEIAPHKGARIILFPMTVSFRRHHNLPPHENSVSLHRQPQASPRRLGSDILRKTRELSWHRCLLGSSRLSQEDQFLTSAGEISLGTGVGRTMSQELSEGVLLCWQLNRFHQRANWLDVSTRGHEWLYFKSELLLSGLVLTHLTLKTSSDSYKFVKTKWGFCLTEFYLLIYSD